MSKLTIIILLNLVTSIAFSQQKSVSSSGNPPALNAITEKDLRTDIFELAGDRFQRPRSRYTR